MRRTLPTFRPNAVPLTGFTPSAESVSLLQTLEATGLRDVFLQGGALRDRYLGIEDRINDYDLVAQFGDRIDLMGADRQKFPQAMADYLCDTLGGVSDMRVSTLSERGGSMAMTLKFKYQGKEMSLSVNDCGFTLESAVGGDAPINCIAMNSKGVVMAHPLFEAHAREKKYAPFDCIPPERAADRLAHLQAKIPGLA